MMKRIWSVFLALCLLLTVSAAVYAVETEEPASAIELTEAEKFFAGIGVTDKERYQPEANPTRAEFAEFLVNVAKLSLENAGADSPFVDVPVTHANYSAISAVYSHGLMGGVGEEKFAPDYKIVLNQAVKVLVELMGYKPNATREGGYPNGYLAVADKLDLLDKISGKSTDNATYRDVLQLFYNAVEVEVQAISGATEDGTLYGKTGKTFSEAVLELKKLEGTVTDNGMTSLVGATKVGKNKMVIAGTTVEVTDNVSYARDYIGLDVDAYYSVEEETELQLVYASPDKNESITFALSDFVSMTQKSVTYFNGERDVTKSISGGVTVIYNGAVLDPVKPELWKGLSGEMTLISTGNRGYDVIVVNAYEDIFVSSVDRNEKIIYNGIKMKPGYANTKVLDFSDSRTYDFLNVVTYDGLPSSFDKIREGDVISAKISQNGRMITLIVEREFTETFVLEDYEAEEKKCTITDGVNRYEIPDYHKLLLPELVRGSRYTVHFNKFGKVVWLEMAESEYPIAFLAGAEENGKGIKDEYKVRLYTEDGDFLVLGMGERIFLNHSGRKTEDVFDEIASFVGSAVLYEAEAGVLTRIVLPEDLGVDTSRGWYRISPVAYGTQADSGMSDADWNAHKETVWSEVGEWRHVGDKFAFVEGTTLGMSVPPEEAQYSNEQGYSIFRNSPKSYTKKAIEGYSREFGDVVADLQLVKVESANMNATEMNMLLISDITTKMNEEGNIVKVIKGYKTSYGNNGVSQVTYPVAEYAVVSGCTMDDIEDVSEGDIMMFSINSKEELTSLEVFYDYSTGMSESMLHSSYHVQKGHVYAGGSDWTRTTSIAPNELDMTNVEHYSQTIGRHHRQPNALIIVTDTNGRLTYEAASVADLKAYTKTYGACDYLVTLSNGSESIYGAVAYR